MRYRVARANGANRVSIRNMDAIFLRRAVERGVHADSAQPDAAVPSPSRRRDAWFVSVFPPSVRVIPFLPAATREVAHSEKLDVPVTVRFLGWLEAIMPV